MAAYISQLNLGGRIGGGQFGDVFEAQCPVHGKVAVKVLKQKAGESLADWASRSDELLHEAQKLKAATHPNVVQVLQVVKDSSNQVVHLISEFCDRGSVDGMYQNGPLPLDKVRKIITDASRGLERVHACGMVHRDIKPANILCHGASFKIGDFGLVSDRLVLGYASADGYICHLAPEVFGTGGASGITSPKSDVWALGMTVYRLLHGHAFFQDNFRLSAADFEQKIVNGGFGPSLPWLPHVPEPWRKFVRKAMHDDTDQRFPTAHAMSQALARLPVTPAWECNFKFDHIVWTRRDGGRDIVVDWRIHSPRKHEWHAKRTGNGQRDVTIGGDGGKIISFREAKTQLENFFATSV